ncbi:MAG TPA: outer membrane beta-barrel protein [Prolixibacteraceae bacterium]|nr:outer membrane beta-barrel protein [Prolixibacteraceae bacterium]HPR84529.1 outer membrane beta-barrel protein [Prolixibacteraceae bacterium]
MKKRFLFIVLLIFTVSFGFAQQFEGGIIGGFNAAQVDGDNYKGYHKPGVALGGYVKTDLSRTVFASMELKLMQKGSRNVDSTATNGQIKYIMRLNYVDLPVYLGFRTSERISILVGVSSGYLLTGNEYNDYGKFPVQDRHPFRSVDLQAMLGFRLQLTNRLSVDVRGAYSLLPIRSQPGTVIWYWKSNQFNNLLSTTILYRLDFM